MSSVAPVSAPPSWSPVRTTLIVAATVAVFAGGWLTGAHWHTAPAVGRFTFIPKDEGVVLRLDTATGEIRGMSAHGEAVLMRSGLDGNRTAAPTLAQASDRK